MDLSQNKLDVDGDVVFVSCILT